MSDRQPTPDVLGTLMSGTAVKEDSNKTIKQEIVKAVKKPGNKAVKKSSNKATITQMMIDGTEEPVGAVQEELKEKATYNLPKKLLERLEDRWMEIRKLSGSKQISKTLIVEKALEMAFDEFDMKKQIGKFYSKLASNKAARQ
jgi:histidinol dehydrogenase